MTAALTMAATMTAATTTAGGMIAFLTAEMIGATISGKAAAQTVAEAMILVGMLGSEVGRQSVRINGGAIVVDMAGMRGTTAASLVASTTTEMMTVAATTTDSTAAAQTAETVSRLLKTAVLRHAIARAAAAGAIRRIAWQARCQSAGTRSR